MTKQEKKLYEPNCADSWDCYEEEVNGKCPECGMLTINGHAAYGCNWSPVECNVCGYAPCDGSC